MRASSRSGGRPGIRLMAGTPVDLQFFRARLVCGLLKEGAYHSASFLRNGTSREGFCDDATECFHHTCHMLRVYVA
jgi:hypothetical protein